MLAKKISVSATSKKQKSATRCTAAGCASGRGGWIRTNAMTESESVALPLGDAPIFNKPIHFIKSRNFLQAF